MRAGSFKGKGLPVPKLTKTSMFTRMNYQVERGMKELLAVKSLSKDDWTVIMEFFGYRCAFCGTSDTGNKRTGLIPDHLIPAVDLGELCIGNVVPACHSCNDRRGKRAWRDYLLLHHQDSFLQRERVILKYLKNYPYQPIEGPAAVLTRTELLEYKRILSQWARVLAAANALRAAITARRRNGT